ncbi:hypothetical protein D3C79_1081980 [compost metagenome]
MLELLADLQLQATRYRLVVVTRFKVVGEIVFAGGVGIRFVMGVTVFVAITQLLHQLGRGIAQV